jgi:hypothetical protein
MLTFFLRFGHLISRARSEELFRCDYYIRDHLRIDWKHVIHKRKELVASELGVPWTVTGIKEL